MSATRRFVGLAVLSVVIVALVLAVAAFTGYALRGIIDAFIFGWEWRS